MKKAQWRGAGREEIFMTLSKLSFYVPAIWFPEAETW